MPTRPLCEMYIRKLTNGVDEEGFDGKIHYDGAFMTCCACRKLPLSTFMKWEKMPINKGEVMGRYQIRGSF